MSRTPKHPDMVRVSIRVNAENDAHISARMNLLQRSYTEVLNTELEWLRDFGLPWPRAQRIYAAAAAKSATPYQYLSQMLTAVAFQLPPPAAAAPTSPRGKAHRLDIHLTGPNSALLTRHAMERKLEVSDALNQLLRFASTYDLPSNLLGSLQAEVARQRLDLRSFVQMKILDAVAALPDAPVQPSTPKRRSK